MINLQTPIEQAPGVGPSVLKKFKRLKIKTVRDLLFHFPYKYDDFSNIIAIEKLKINEICTISGKVLGIETSRSWKKNIYITEALVEDKTSAVKAVWFNQLHIQKIIKKGDLVFLSGKAVAGKNGVYLSNPSFEKFKSEPIHTGRLIPSYSKTEGLSSKWIRRILAPLLKDLHGRIPETLPQEIIQSQNLLPVEQALWQIHFPSSKEKASEAKKRFSFEEIFFIQLFVLRERNLLSKEKSASVPVNLGVIKRLADSLPFKLTDAQRKSAWRILNDTEKERPMNRLLEGDVGSGKTIVAAMACLNTAKAGYQSALMAPTEILAKQHFQEISKTLQDFRVNIGLLTGKQDQFRSKKLKNQVIEISRKKLLEKTLSGEMDILIGTHALIQDKVKFGKLALVVLDEQHRFGVAQRSKLVSSGAKKEKPLIPHLLSMTATPIPRTLALTIYGDLDLSIIDELPKGRKKILTKIINPLEREKTYDFVAEEIKKGRQAFIICPRIEKKEDGIKNTWSETKTVKEESEKLKKEIFPDLKIGTLHGKMPPKEKEKVMNDFRNKKTDILVSTSVVEVGIDVPNATVMLIEGAERFGLAQLHQFRGRVGRGEYQSYCLLFSDKPKERLLALVKSEDGFSLAEKDLRLRGPGDFAGTKQWGIPDLLMDALKDMGLVEKTRETAKEFLQKNPHLKNYLEIQKRLSEFRERIHLE
ncbi:MAG: ATP-dependent DNA helicase RecG [Candidatus Nealsonbacteria bacterium RIFOXYB1_FULL_40_15]|uniref:ATP-dependent DNA helicase RecG n=1 Tax=Candidatus Nealsonbacteria bacterium RIFOXYB1_FULL_40_15 TaxID=1801677 RepID=A0A1G2ENB4_9BACT|nr:MAG: ATP-dependent DNA helicase RecG [Candidatus Nealsonbacteria bacterium RIFOXYB1_FULL_40_15]OGZ28311.1 MAG: ATP-dependent DNA helicase RecG [Candidatus Nealsonbacteria bacterium RIFOXYD1_FULL_39_11]